MELTAVGDVTIIDFKTGEPKESDEQQLLLYAFLWARDRVKNPKGHLATKLILQYPDVTKTVDAPDSAALGAIEKDLEEQSSAIHNTLKR